MKLLPIVLLAVACPRPPIAEETGDCALPEDSRAPDSRAPDSGDTDALAIGFCTRPWSLPTTD